MIYLSIGHHKNNAGACHNGWCEFDEAQRWVNLIAGRMGESKCVIVPTGKLTDKVSFINKRKPLAAIEMHFNSMQGGTNADGCEVLYHPESVAGKSMAIELNDSLVHTGFRNRGAKQGYYRGLKSNGVLWKY